MVEATLRVVDENVAYTGVHATRGKVVRAQPVAALYEQGRVRHMGAFTALAAPGATRWVRGAIRKPGTC